MGSSPTLAAIPGSVSLIRRLPSWVDAYEELTEGLPTPEIFRKWAAISALAGAMEQRVWISISGMTLYPNLYALLVGPPGIGKGVAMSPVEDLWRQTPGFYVAPSSVSKASLMDSLKDAMRRIARPGMIPPYVEFNSLLVAAREFGHFLPTYEPEFMAAITDIWDNKTYEERKRGGDLKFKIEKPTVNILGACTPNYLLTTFPEGAWDQGFASRVIMVYSGERMLHDPFGREMLNERLFKDLLADMKVISNLYGKMEWMPDAVEAFRAWHMKGGPPTPEHHKLQNYNSRRTTNLAKLCMVASISRGNDFTIALQDYETALNWLIEAEFFMPDIFKAMVTGGDSAAMDETWQFLWNAYVKSGQKPITESRIVHFLRERVPNHSILSIVDTLLRSKMIEVAGIVNGQRLFKPVPKILHGS